jgi:hypothetical protein
MMTGSYRTIRPFRAFFIATPHGSAKRRTRRRAERRCFRLTVGVMPGGIAYMTLYTTIPAFMRCSASRAVTLWCNSINHLDEARPGDVAILPARTGQRRLRASDDLLVVGANPPTGKYEEYGATREAHDRALAQVTNGALPQSDPVYGLDGPLVLLWREA